jgi:hypothetical protein
LRTGSVASLQQQKQTLAKFKIADLDLDRIDVEIPAQVLATLTTDQYLALLDAEHGPFEELDSREEVPLIGLRTAIETLLARGAAGRDFKDIYCEECNFSAAKSLDQAIFDGSYLSEANFTHVSLRGASFRDADIGGTNFFGADLTNADLHAERLWGAFRGFAPEFPVLECAKLRGTNLSGQPLVRFKKEFSTTPTIELAYDISSPRMVSVQLDASTKLDDFTILSVIEISDDYLKQHTAAPEVQYLTRNRQSLWENPLVEGGSQTPDFRRFRANRAEDAAKHTRTIAVLGSRFDSDALKHLAKDAFMLRGFIDQPTLKALPLYSRFVDTVATLNVPEGDAGKPARAWSDKAAKTWATMKPPSCSEQPQADILRLDLGTHASTEMPE